MAKSNLNFVHFLVESVNFEAPLMTEMRPETEQTRVGGNWHKNNSSSNNSNNSHSNNHVKDVEDDLNLALDEALENYDLATSWMEGDGEKEVVRK